MPFTPAPDAILTIDPPPDAAMTGIAALHIRKVEVRFSLTQPSHSSGVISTTVLPGLLPPTTLTRIDRPPKASDAARTADSAPARVVASAMTVRSRSGAVQ